MITVQTRNQELRWDTERGQWSDAELLLASRMMLDAFGIVEKIESITESRPMFH